MTRTKLYPVTVTKYDVGNVADAIRHVTGWEQRSEVLDKTHLTYLDRYVNNLEVKTMVIENEYIDRHYIEDYAEYYARCFHQHPRTCSRIHFFRNEFKEADFIGAVSGTNPALIGKLQDEENYLGFVVLRPIPKTCIARMCLRPYEFNGTTVKIQKSMQSVSLFGIDLAIETLPFLEQDKVVSACATSAIWVLLNAHQKAAQDALPSPSAITKSAFSPQLDEGRVFPAHGGLNLQQVARSLKAYGLEPTIFTAEQFGEKVFPLIVKEILFAYGASNIPVLLGVDAHEIADGKENRLGRHLVCALGYRTKPSGSAIPVCPTAIDRVYVHDDRYGPYVALEVSGDPRLQLMWGNDGSSELREVMDLKAVVIGLYHKVRIDYLYVRNLCASMKSIVEALHKFVAGGESEGESSSSALEKFCRCECVITLAKIGSLKSEIRQSAEFFSYNGIADKTALLLENFPKYIWRCSFYDGKKRFLDFLIDATEVPQGNLILGGIQYSDEADQFWRGCKKLFDGSGASAWLAKYCAAEARQYVSAFGRFFTAKDNDALNSYYGQVRLPNRPVRNAEVDEIGNTVPLTDTRHFIFGQDPSALLATLSKDATYLWVIDEDGTLILGREEGHGGVDTKDKPAGHPSLTKSRAARLGGELKHADGKWILNTRSATYSNHISTQEVRDAHLSNVIRLNFANNPSVVMSEKF